MNTMSASLIDVLKSLMQALRISSILPAAVFVALNCLLFSSKLASLELSAGSRATLIGTAVLVVSYLLYAFNAPLIRLAEGYPFRLERLGRRLSKRQQDEYRRFQREIELSNEMLREIRIRQGYLLAQHGLDRSKEHPSYQKLEDWKTTWQIRRNLARQKLHYHYPYPKGDEKDVVPTLLGNTVASFERYPDSRYGIDAVAVWPRLVPILQSERFIPLVQNEKTVFDFLLNLACLTLLLAIEVGWFLSALSPFKGILLCAGFVFLAYVLYRAAVVGAVNWGITVKVAFDLYRGHLREALNLREPTSLDQEKRDWSALSKFYVDGSSFDQFVYEGQTEPEPARPEKPTDKKVRRICWLWRWVRP